MRQKKSSRREKDLNATEIKVELEELTPSHDGDHTQGKGKRKRAMESTDDAQSTLQIKKAKTTIERGGQDGKGLTGLPSELLVEIFSQLNPKDLLYLAQTNKDLRAVLMHRSSAGIWGSARSNVVPAMPECPKDLSEPAYAALLFAEYCQYCLKETYEVYWHARRRICVECVPEVCIKGFKGNFHGIKFPNMWLRYPSYTSNNWVFADEYYDTWAAAYKKVKSEKARRLWLEQLQEGQEMAKAHGEACRLWAVKCREMKQREQQEIKKKQELELCKKQQVLVSDFVKSLGWADEVSKLRSDDLFENTYSMKSKCSRDVFTETTLPEMEERINQYMPMVRKARILNALSRGKAILENAYQIYMGTDGSYDCRELYPTVEELLLEPPILNIFANTSADKGLSNGDFLPTIASVFPEMASRFRRRIDEQLLVHLREAFPTQYANGCNDRVRFDLATTIFTCSNAEARRHDPASIWYEDIPSNQLFSCIELDDIALQSEVPDYLAEIIRDSKIASQTCAKTLCVDQTAVKVINKMLGLCGFDPSITTRDMMDKANPIYECLGCHDKLAGRFTMTWMGVIHHFNKTHYYRGGVDSFKLEILTEEDAEKARLRIIEIQERTQAKDYPCIMACVHCGDRTPNTRYQLVNHVRHIHGIEDVDDTDFTSRPYYETPTSFQMWPPRRKPNKSELQLSS